MIDHPPREWLTGFLLGRLTPLENRTVVVHLLSGCPSCREEMAPLAQAMFRPGRCEVPPDPDDPDYDDPVGRACASVLDWSRRRDRERQEAESKAGLLLYGGLRAGETPLPERPGFWTWGLCEVLLEKSWSLRHDDPKKMLHLAGLARDAADRLDSDLYGESVTCDLRARAWGEYANACRVADDLLKAEEALGRALELRKQGSGSALLRARLAELTAGLLCHQRRFPPAFRALDLAYTLHQRHGQPENAVRVLVKRGIYTGRSGDPEMGIRYLSQALPQIDGERDSKLRFLTLHNVLLFRVEQGEFQSANLQLFEMRPLYVQHAGAVDLVKLRWIEAKIFAGIEDLERAERAFRQVREEFQKQGQAYHAAVVGLELAELWLRQGRTAEVQTLVGEILDVFRSRYVARESVAAILTLREALDRDRATLDLVKLVARLVEQHQNEAAGNGIALDL
jgi:tetratricopeptide (TPR) repeat protein